MWQMKHSSRNPTLLMLLWTAGAVAACQSVVPNGEIVQTPLAVIETSQMPIDTLAAPPGGGPPKLIAFSQDEMPKFTTTRGSLPRKLGNYLVYGERSGEHAGEIMYVSTDGVVYGDLFNYSLIDDWLPVPFMSTPEEPRFVFTDYQEGELSLRNGKINIWVRDVTGNSIKNWHGEIVNGSKIDCTGPSFSPSGRWVVMVCTAHYEYYANLIDLYTGEERIISVPGGANLPQSQNWSEDETRFYTWDSSYKYCFVFLSNNSATCRDLGRQLLAVSPDWTKAALRYGDMPRTPEGNLPGAEIVIVDLKCLLYQVNCEQGKRFDLPFYKAMGGEIYSVIGLNWESSGTGLAWISAPYINAAGQAGGHLESFSSGWIDLAGNNNQILWQGPQKDTKLLGESPDGKWLLFSDQQGLYLGSPQNHTVRRLVISEYETFFYGWLVAP